MPRKIRYSEGRRIKKEGVKKREKTHRYRRRRAGDTSAKGRRRERDK
jgi:hypothetical protein